MLLVLLPGVAVILLIFLMWFLCHNYHDVYDGDVGCLIFFVIGGIGVVFLIFSIIAIMSSSGYHDNDHVALVNSRHVIQAKINSKDQAVHNEGIDEAVAYNQAIKTGKDRLINPWTSWITDRIWADAEFIEINADDYVYMNEESEVTECS